MISDQKYFYKVYKRKTIYFITAILLMGKTCYRPLVAEKLELEQEAMKKIEQAQQEV